MIREKEHINQMINRGEDYISRHPEIIRMNANELYEYFDNAEYDLGVNWAVMALIIANSLKTTHCEELVTELSLLDEADLTKQYIGYLLYNKYSVNMESVLLQSEEMGVVDKILPYVVHNIVFQKAYHVS